MSGNTTPITSATTQASISTALPATYDVTTFTALTWLPIGLVSDMGTVGGTMKTNTHIPVDTGIETKIPGSVSYGAMTMKIARHKGAEIDALRTAFTNRTQIAVKVQYPTIMGEVDFFTAYVTSIPTNIGNADTIIEMTVNLELTNAVLTKPAP